jgi:uncharacterized protein (TIGR02118 family)
MIKLVYCLRRRSDVSPEEFRSYWLERHGPRVRGHAEVLKARKYVQSHTVDSPLNDVLTESRGMKPPYDGITEVWWDGVKDLEQALATPEGQAAGDDLIQDEAKFIDLGESRIFLTEEHTIFDLQR